MIVMIMVVLLCHILLAILSLGYAATVIVATNRKDLDTAANRTKTMFYSTASAVLSGVLLTVITGVSFGRMCVSLLVFLSLVGVAYYYRRPARQKTGCPYLDEL